VSKIAPLSHTSTRVSQQNTKGYARSVFWVMFSISFLNYLDRNVLTGAANVIAKELGFQLDGIGYIASAFLIINALFTLPLGIWADHAKRKDIIALCVAVWSIATAATALVTSFATLFISRMVLGIGEAGYFPAGTALMSDYFHHAERSRVMSWWSTAQLFGIFVGFGVGGALAGLSPGSWRLAFLVTGIPGLFLAFLMWRVREPQRNQADEEAHPGMAEEGGEIPGAALQEAVPLPPMRSSLFSQLGSLLRIKTLVVLIAIQVFAFFVLGVTTTFLPTYIQQKDTFGLSSGQAGLFAGAVIAGAGTVGTVLGGYMADALNRRHPGARVLVCGIGFLLAAPALALALTSHDLRVFTVFFIITALLLLLYHGPSTAATQDVVPSTLRASAVAISLLIAHLLGDALAPTIVGVLATTFDPTHGLHFQKNVAGQDLGMALLVTCTPALVAAGLIGIFGARWVKRDMLRAEHVDRAMKK